MEQTDLEGDIITETIGDNISGKVVEVPFLFHRHPTTLHMKAKLTFHSLGVKRVHYRRASVSTRL